MQQTLVMNAGLRSVHQRATLTLNWQRANASGVLMLTCVTLHIQCGATTAFCCNVNIQANGVDLYSCNNHLSCHGHSCGVIKRGRKVESKLCTNKTRLLLFYVDLNDTTFGPQMVFFR